MRRPASATWLLLLLLPALVVAGVLADRAMRRDEQQARERAEARRVEASRQGADAFAAALARLDELAVRGEPTGSESFRVRLVPPPRVSAAPREKLRSATRDRLGALLSSREVTPNALPEAVAAAVALDDASSRDVVAEALLGGRLPVRPDDLPVLAEHLGHADDPRIATLQRRLLEIPDAPPALPEFARTASSGVVTSWSRDGASAVSWRMPIEEIAAAASLPPGSVGAEGAPIPGLDGVRVSVPLDLRDARRSRALRVAVLALLGATGAAGFFAARALSRESRILERERAFLATVSHEMRTPVTAARLLGETLAEGRGDARAYGELIAREAGRLEALVEKSLLAARTDVAPVFAACDPAEILNNCTVSHAPLAARLGKSVTCDVSGLPRAHWDADAVRQAVSNLVDNALRHGGSNVVLSARAGGDAVRVEVEDDGPGLHGVDRRRVFGRFARGATEAPGTGLGLWLVDRVARSHGGSVDVRSEPGRCAFVMTLPLRSPGAS